MTFFPRKVVVCAVLMLIVVVVPVTGTQWTFQSARASGPNLSGLSRLKGASSIFGPTTGKHSHRIHPDAFIPGRQLPGLAGHAVKRAGHNVFSSHFLHANTTFASNVVVSTDTTPAPFGPEPRNGPQAAVDPGNSNRIVVVYNDYTTAGQGGNYSVGYTISTDNGQHWASSQLVHAVLKIDGGAYDAASDPGIAFDASRNAYLSMTAFNEDDWQTAVYIAKMPAGGTQFSTPVKVVAYNDTHHVVEFARVTTAANNTLYLTFNALSTTPQAPNSPLAASWTSQLYFTRSTDGGQTWSTPLAIGGGPQDYWGVPVVTANGTLNVFYSGNTEPLLTQSTNGGQTWSGPHCLASQNGCQMDTTVGEQRGLNGIYINPGPDAVADGNNLYVVYDGGKVTISTNGGSVWSKPMDVLGSSYEPAYLAAIGVDPASHTVSVGGYSSAGDASGNSYNYYYAQSSDGGNHFSSPILVSTNVSLPPAPAFGSIGRVSSVVGGGSSIHLFWTDTNATGGNEQIMTAGVNVNQPVLGALQSSWDSGQSIPPWGLIFTASGTQTIGVNNYGQGGFAGIGAVNVSTTGGSWLSAAVSNNSNSYTVTVSVTAGTNNEVGSITITSTNGANSSITIPVQLLVTTVIPAFSLSRTTLSFTAQQGVDPAPQSIQINSLSYAGDMVQFNISNDTALYVDSLAGPQSINLKPGVPSGFIVQIITSDLSVGSSSHQITVSDGNTSVTVTINVTITAGPAQLDDPASSLTFNYHLQSGLTPQPQTLTLYNSGGSPLNWKGMTDASWLNLSPAAGTLAAGNSASLPVNVSIATISQTGTLIGHIILSGDVQAINLPEVITVYFVISPATTQVSRTWYFAEGYASPSFNEYLTLENPNPQLATVSVTYLTQPVNSPPRPPFILNYTVSPNTRYTIWINGQPGMVQNDQVSLVVNSNIPIVAERPMYFNYTLLSPNPSGGTDVVGATHQGSAFFFPFVQFGHDQQMDSPTYGTSYITYLTVLNQNNAPVNVAISYEGANSLYTVTHQIAANTRGTVSLADDFPLANSPNHNSYLYATSLMVTTDQPVVVELPSYFTIPDTHIAVASGTDEVGATAPQTIWDFAEGYTGTNNNQFLTYLDLANTGDTPTTATITLAVTNGSNPLTPIKKQYTVPPQSSIAVWLNPIVCQTTTYCGLSVGAHVAATQPIVVDREMLFDYQGKILGSTAVVGSAGPQSQFYFAEGYTGPGFSEYLTIVNPATNTSAERVSIRYLIQGGSPKTVTLPQLLQPSQRWTEMVNNDVGANQQLSVVVTTNTGTLIVERPMYFNYHNSVPGGSDVIGYSAGN